MRTESLTESVMLKQARALFNEMVLTQRWVAKSDGVYVRVAPGMHPSANEAKMLGPEFQIKDTIGRTYILKNPSIATVEISQMANNSDLFALHPTSLRPLNPKTGSPDAFERAALKSFEQGKQEFFSIIHRKDGAFYRYMAPLRYEQSCNKCHARQGYKLGDIRGGISITIPMSAVHGEMRANRLYMILAGITVLVLLCGALYFLSAKFLKALRDTQGKLVKMAATDELTGLPNRRAGIARMEEEISRYRRSAEPLSCLLLDIDHFKRINDNYGHQAGDLALTEIARILRGCLRHYDCVCRYGGEEFLLILPGANIQAALSVAEKIRQSLADTAINYNDATVKVTASIGLAETTGGILADIDTIINNADTALYKAKARGRNRIEVFMMQSNTAPVEKTPVVPVIEEAHEYLEAGSDVVDILESITDAFFALDSEWRFTYVNKIGERMLQKYKDELLGKELWDEFPVAVELKFYREFHRALEENVQVKMEEFYEPFDRWYEVNAYPYRDGLFVYFSDITEQKRAEQQLNFMAFYDSLTGLPNRTLLDDRLSLACAHAHRNSDKFAVLHIDLDNFKTINDTLGHIASDELLRAATKRLLTHLREGDTVARVSGDEFVVLLPQVNHEEDVAIIAQKLLETIRRPISVSNQDVYVTASIGISLYPHDGIDGQALLRHADAALGLSKDQGKNNYQFYSPDLNDKVLKRFAMENLIHRALDNDEFMLYYQPLVDSETNTIVGMEALLRWENPELGTVSPLDFIPIAEETGLIISIGEWVLQEACRQTKVWHDAGYPPIKVSVNLSPRQIQQQNLVETVKGILAETGLEPQYLELELTEGTVMKDAEKAIAVLAQFKEMGIRIAIDDFGTGYSSLSYLKQFPVDKLKIDRSFISSVDKDPSDAAIISTIIAMAHNLNLGAVAEGIETQAQLECLRSLNCGEMQGFLFSEPLTAEKFAELLKKAKRMCA
jgi:diguanylate cyclase (GGDEF)-like protein/PAS domain S-box-containing protein